MTLFAIWLDNGGAHEPMGLMSVWTTKELAEAEIARLQRDVYVFKVFKVPQRFWLSDIGVDTPYDTGAEPYVGSAIPYPPL